MKKIFLFFILSIVALLSFGQVTESPKVSSTNVSGTSIVGIRISPEQTTIFLHSPIGYGEWVSISPRTMIQYNSPSTGNLVSIYLTDLQNTNLEHLSLGTKYFYLPHNGLVLTFPPIPRGVSMINLIEEDGWKWYGINITPRSDIDVKKMANNESAINKLIADSKNKNSGIFEQLSVSEDNPSGYRLALVQNEEGTFLIYVSSAKPTGSWKCGEVKAILRPTVSGSIYKADWYMADKTKESAIVTLDGAIMKIQIGVQGYGEDTYVKMSNGNGENNQNANLYSEKWSGTGFALKNGYIITNHHVIDEANNIDIYGINGDFTQSYKAKVVGSDKVNDLALLKITSPNFKGLGNIPYSFKSKLSDVGENIFVLGFPLTATMGDEIKLTNGIISAKTGYEGDVSQYQISAPVQPGNSGGPLFDSNGNIIGVICAKHRGAENVSYAIKTSYVRNLIESVSNLSIMNTTNQISGKALKDQVKLVNKFVYIIKCSK